MLRHIRTLSFAVALSCLAILTGCASRERAMVNFSYVVEPERGLPPGMNTIAIEPASVGPTTDTKWSELCATILQNLVSESHNRFGTEIEFVDRRDTQVTFDEADLAAAGMSTRSGGSGGKLLAADGVILSNINVKVEKHHGKASTISGIDLSVLTGRDWYGRKVRGGRGAIETREVDTVTRSMTVQTEFKLVDTGNNKVWEHYSPRTYRGTDRTKASPIFGSSATEAELTPRDEIIATLAERAATEFISRLMPCRIDVDVVVESSTNQSCTRGVRLLRAEAYDDAAAMFKAALSEKPSDHRAAFGAGVACEAAGQYDEALSFYQRACAGRDDPQYREARDRMKSYARRARQPS